jgi:hypothetical protein
VQDSLCVVLLEGKILVVSVHNNLNSLVQNSLCVVLLEGKILVVSVHNNLMA